MHCSRFHPGVRFLKLKPCTWLILLIVCPLLLHLAVSRQVKMVAVLCLGASTCLRPQKNKEICCAFVLRFFFARFPPFYCKFD